MTQTNILMNITIYTPGAQCIGVDIKDFYLKTPFLDYEYPRIQIHLFPQEIINTYGLTEKVKNRHIMV